MQIPAFGVEAGITLRCIPAYGLQSHAGLIVDTRGADEARPQRRLCLKKKERNRYRKDSCRPKPDLSKTPFWLIKQDAPLASAKARRLGCKSQHLALKLGLRFAASHPTGCLQRARHATHGIHPMGAQPRHLHGIEILGMGDCHRPCRPSRRP